MSTEVVVTAFKQDGKFYTSDTVTVSSDHLYGALEQVKQQIRDGAIVVPQAVESYHFLVKMEKGDAALDYLLLIGKW